MRIVDVGQGPPLVLVPSLQGRWEYLKRAIDALSRSHRVLTFSLGDERIWRPRLDLTRGLDAFADQIALVMDERKVARAAVCGFSFGGRVALRFAAAHPERVAALVLVSTPGPGWHLKPAHRTYARNPLLLAPAFFAGAPGRVRAELAAAFPDWRDRWRFAREQVRTFLTAPLSPSRMAARARLIDGTDVEPDCARVSAPVLLVTGEQGLDHVVPASGTTAFARLIRDARAVTLPQSGHFGCVTRPEAFADLVSGFLRQTARGRQPEDTYATA